MEGRVDGLAWNGERGEIAAVPALMANAGL